MDPGPTSSPSFTFQQMQPPFQQVPTLPLGMEQAAAIPSVSPGVDTSSAAVPTVSRKRRQFARELRAMMHGFGDDISPLDESVDLIEDLAVNFMTSLLGKAMDLVDDPENLHVEDILFLLRKDPVKYGRGKELVDMYKVIKEARDKKGGLELPE